MIADYEGDVKHLFEAPKESVLPILATRNLVLFPGVVTPVLIGRNKSRMLVEKIRKNPDALMAVICQRDQDIEDPAPEDLFKYGVVAKIIRVLDIPNQEDRVTVIVQSLGRIVLKKIVKETPYLVGEVEAAPEIIASNKDKEYRAAMEDLRRASTEYIKKNEDIPDEAQFAVNNIDNDVIAANFLCSSLPLDLPEKMMLLEKESTKERVFELLKILYRATQLEQLKQNIRLKTREDIDEQQREYFLQQQIKNIREELGNHEGSPERKELLEQAARKIWSGNSTNWIC